MGKWRNRSRKRLSCQTWIPQPLACWSSMHTEAVVVSSAFLRRRPSDGLPPSSAPPSCPLTSGAIYALNASLEITKTIANIRSALRTADKSTARCELTRTCATIFLVRFLGILREQASQHTAFLCQRWLVNSLLSGCP